MTSPTRRTFAQVLTAVATVSGSAITMSDSASASDESLPPLDLVQHDREWLYRQLRGEYDAWHRPPGHGIYHLGTDYPVDVPTTYDAIVSRAKVLADLSHPPFREGVFDCEDAALWLRSLLVQAYPTMSVGVAFNVSGDHVYNVFVTDDDGVVEFEPQTATVVTDSDRSRYDFNNGVLLL